MEENSKVTVKIYGQEYTIAGTSTADRIVVVANHVDSMMNELAQGMGTLPVSTLAVLTAVNTANDLFDASDKIAALENVVSGLRKDAEHYIQLWEDAKASFKQYKDDAQDSVEQLQELQRIFNLKNVELNKANETIEELKKELENAREKLSQEEADIKETGKEAEDTLSKYKELENSFFDIQMENIQLKNELDNLKKSGK
jgi:cell division protein ZapA